MGFGSPLQSTAIRAGYMTCRALGHPGRMKVSGDRHVGLDVASGEAILTQVLSAPRQPPTHGGISRVCSRPEGLREHGVPLDREPPSPKPLLDARAHATTAGG